MKNLLELLTDAAPGQRLALRATAALSFSGFASVPVIREDLVVTRGTLTDEELNSAIAISQRLRGLSGCTSSCSAPSLREFRAL
jgi:hypothetical protein